MRCLREVLNVCLCYYFASSIDGSNSIDGDNRTRVYLLIADPLTRYRFLLFRMNRNLFFLVDIFPGINI